MKNNIEIKENERIDDLHRNGYLLIQNTKMFGCGSDAVWLSGFAQVKKGENVIDLGTGTGVIPILLEAKTKGNHFTGLEIQKESAEMAKRSVLLNGLQNKISIDQGDIKQALSIYGKSVFDVVTSNPPYMNYGGGLKNDFTPKAIARHEVLCNLEDIIYNASKLLKTGGRFYMVHKPHRLADIIVTMRCNHLEPKRIRFVHSYENKEPSLILIEGARNGKPMIKVESPLIIYQKDGSYTEEIHKIYYE